MLLCTVMFGSGRPLSLMPSAWVQCGTPPVSWALDGVVQRLIQGRLDQVVRVHKADVITCSCGKARVAGTGRAAVRRG